MAIERSPARGRVCFWPVGDGKPLRESADVGRIKLAKPADYNCAKFAVKRGVLFVGRLPQIARLLRPNS